MKKYYLAVMMASLFFVPVVSQAAAQYSGQHVQPAAHQQNAYRKVSNNMDSCHNPMMNQYIHTQCNESTNYGARAQMDSCTKSMVSSCERTKS